MATAGGAWDVVVLGSINVDVVLGVAALPRPGETVLARSRETGPGGKGGNQALAAARSGARTAFVGAIGSDEAGREAADALVAAGVDLRALRQAAGRTGTAYVVVDDRGENAIVVDPGANAELTAPGAADTDVLTSAGVLLCQLEVPPDTVLAALELARAAGVLTVLNAAPAQPLSDRTVAALDVLVVNEQEAHVVAGTSGDLATAVELLLRRVPEVVVTVGAAGALVGRRDAPLLRVPGVPARVVVDTTGAGDTFCGAYAAARARGEDSVEAARTGCAAASLSVERPGAGLSAPTAEQVRARLAAG